MSVLDIMLEKMLRKVKAVLEFRDLDTEKSTAIVTLNDCTARVKKNENADDSLQLAMLGLKSYQMKTVSC